jgi:hypothetical protein
MCCLGLYVLPGAVLVASSGVVARGLGGWRACRQPACCLLGVTAACRARACCWAQELREQGKEELAEEAQAKLELLLTEPKPKKKGKKKK